MALRQALRKFHKKRREKALIRTRSVARATELDMLSLDDNFCGVGNDKPEEIIISLTSYDKRIHDIHLSIESLFRQSVKADKVVLWLSEQNFPDKKIPEILLKQQDRGLQIEFVDEDWGCYKKIIYSLKAFPNSIIITADDDVLYPLDMVDQLYQSYLKNTQAVHCQRGHRIEKDSHDKLQPYRQWPAASGKGGASSLIFPTGIAGVLYPPGSLDPEVSNVDAFMKLCPGADDVWLKAMALKNGVQACQVDDPRNWKMRFLDIPGSQEHSLKKQNWQEKGGNDAKIDAVFSTYDLYKYL